MKTQAFTIESNNPATDALMLAVGYIATAQNFVTAQGDASRRRIQTAYDAQYLAIGQYFRGEDSRARYMTATVITVILAIATAFNYVLGTVKVIRQTVTTEPTAPAVALLPATDKRDKPGQYWVSLRAFLGFWYGQLSTALWVANLSTGTEFIPAASIQQLG